VAGNPPLPSRFDGISIKNARFGDVCGCAETVSMSPQRLSRTGMPCSCLRRL